MKQADAIQAPPQPIREWTCGPQLQVNVCVASRISACSSGTWDLGQTESSDLIG